MALFLTVVDIAEPVDPIVNMNPCAVQYGEHRTVCDTIHLMFRAPLNAWKRSATRSESSGSISALMSDSPRITHDVEIQGSVKESPSLNGWIIDVLGDLELAWSIIGKMKGCREREHTRMKMKTNDTERAERIAAVAVN